MSLAVRWMLYNRPMKKSVKKRVKEAMEKYKPEKEKIPNEQQFSPKSAPKQSSGFTARPDKKRG